MIIVSDRAVKKLIADLKNNAGITCTIDIMTGAVNMSWPGGSRDLKLMHDERGKAYSISSESTSPRQFSMPTAAWRNAYMLRSWMLDSPFNTVWVSTNYISLYTTEEGSVSFSSMVPCSAKQAVDLCTYAQTNHLAIQISESQFSVRSQSVGHTVSPKIVAGACEIVRNVLEHANPKIYLSIIMDGELLAWREVFLEYKVHWLHPERNCVSDPTLSTTEFIEECIDRGLESLL